jgi:hypothetical protein
MNVKLTNLSFEICKKAINGIPVLNLKTGKYDCYVSFDYMPEQIKKNCIGYTNNNNDLIYKLYPGETKSKRMFKISYAKEYKCHQQAFIKLIPADTKMMKLMNDKQFNLSEMSNEFMRVNIMPEDLDATYIEGESKSYYFIKRIGKSTGYNDGLLLIDNYNNISYKKNIWLTFHFTAFYSLKFMGKGFVTICKFFGEIFPINWNRQACALKTIKESFLIKPNENIVRYQNLEVFVELKPMAQESIKKEGLIFYREIDPENFLENNLEFELADGVKTNPHIYYRFIEGGDQ